MAVSTEPVADLVMPPTDHHPHPYHGPTKAEVLAMRKEYCNPAISTYYKEPLMIVEGHMQYLYDETGRRYLDMLAGIVTVSCGHCHPKVTAKIKEQVDTLQHATTIYAHPNMPALAKKLASKMPKGLDVTYFVNSGSEANDLAIQMARLYTGNADVIAVRNSYHGASPSSNTITSHSTWKYPVNPSGGIHHAINPDPYRSPFTGTPEEIATKSANDIKELIRFSTPGRIAAFIAEPIQGVGGTTHGAKNYLREAYAVARDHGGLCIADEVQTGFGRTGDHYWGFQNFDVVIGQRLGGAFRQRCQQIDAHAHIAGLHDHGMAGGCGDPRLRLVVKAGGADDMDDPRLGRQFRQHGGDHRRGEIHHRLRRCQQGQRIGGEPDAIGLHAGEAAGIQPKIGMAFHFQRAAKRDA